MSNSVLKTRRKEKGLSLSKVAQELGIRVGYLRAIEDKDWEKLPDLVYARAFIARYAHYLGFSQEKSEQLKENLDTAVAKRKNKAKQADEQESGKANFLRRNIHILVWISLFGVVAAYLIWQASFLVRGPSLIVNPLPAVVSVEDLPVIIEGRVKRAFTLTVNGELVTLDKEGDFRIPLNLQTGPHTIALEAKDRFGHLEKVVYEVMVTKDNSTNIIDPDIENLSK